MTFEQWWSKEAHAIEMADVPQILKLSFKELAKSAWQESRRRLYRMVELKDGVNVQHLGVYVLHWQKEWGQPEVGFVEALGDGQ